MGDEHMGWNVRTMNGAIMKAVLCLLTIVILLPCALYAQQEDDGLQQIRIGVLAKRGAARCLEKWGATAEYLNSQISGYSFTIVPLGFDEIHPAVEKKEVDFILSNPAFYVQLDVKYGVSRIATLKNRRLGQFLTQFGGVLFCRNDRDDIQNSNDLRGQRFITVSKGAFGAWAAVLRHMKEKGIEPYKDFASVEFGGSHDSVVYAVRDGKVDVGSTRTDTLERMAKEGKIRLEDFRGLDLQPDPQGDFPLLRTTRLYPEWPFAKVKHVSDQLAKKVAVALLEMEPETAAAQASLSGGWTIPLNYQPVHDCLKIVKIAPYENYGQVTFVQFVRQHWLFVAGTILFVVFVSAIAFHMRNLNQKLQTAVEDFEMELYLRKQGEAEREKLQAELLQAQKLESVGQLAAGIAHEINTPIQYVGSNTAFLAEAFEDLKEVVTKFHVLLKEAKKESFSPQYVAQVETCLEEADWDYLVEEIPDTICQSQDGIRKVSQIVQAMKEFSHPHSKDKDPVDLNHLIETTVIVAKNEWKYVADLEMDLDQDLPPIPCFADEMGQVFLNILVNAAHAIAEKIGANPEGEEKGMITISTNFDEEWAEVRISDTGLGIPEENRAKIFDLFFTTKEVGKGTGQGMAISHGVITKKHGGSISFETTIGVGTVFVVKLPIQVT